MKNDKYRQARGGWSRILDIRCSECEGHVCFYQKDGPGPLKRMYVDRFIVLSPTDNVLSCPTCKVELGTCIVYKKENRPAYRLFQDAIRKKIVKG